MRASTIVSTVAIATLGAQAAPAPLEARTLDFLAQAIQTATTTVENWFLYPNCMWVGVQSNPGYAVYKGWDNNAANVSLQRSRACHDADPCFRSRAVRTPVPR